MRRHILPGTGEYNQSLFLKSELSLPVALEVATGYSTLLIVNLPSNAWVIAIV